MTSVINRAELHDLHDRYVAPLRTDGEYRSDGKRKPGGLPENSVYRDDGCSLAPRCLDCPLPQCRYDLPPGELQAMLRRLEFRRYLVAGLSVADAARRVGVAERTAWGWLREARTNAVKVEPPALPVLPPPRTRITPDRYRCERLNGAYSHQERGYQGRGQRCRKPGNYEPDGAPLCYLHWRQATGQPTLGGRASDPTVRARLMLRLHVYRERLGLGAGEPWPNFSGGQRLPPGVRTQADLAREHGVSINLVSRLAMQAARAEVGR